MAYCLTIYRHIAAKVVNLFVEAEAEPIGVTGNHRFWSADRHDFVRADALQVGERFSGRDGQPPVVKVVPVPGRHTVYNLEVEGAHVYHVTGQGILVHNAGGTCAPYGPLPSGSTITKQGPGYVVYQPPQGPPQIRFDATAANYAGPHPVNPGSGNTNLAEAGINANGVPFVLEGKGRAFGAANQGVTFPESLGGIPGAQPGWLQYNYYPNTIPQVGIPVKVGTP